MRSKIDRTWWDFQRHLLGDLDSCPLEGFSLPGWNQAGMFILCSVENLGESRVMLYLAPVLRMAFRLGGSCLDEKHLRLMIDCRKKSNMVGLSLLSFCALVWVQVRIISRAASEARG